MAVRLSTGILILATVLQIIVASSLFPKSCLQVKQFSLTNGDKNGYFVLYDDLRRPFATYCDFKSDPGFVWTLIESLSLSNGQSTKYRKSFHYNVPSPGCTPNWLEYRLSTSRMKSIKNTPGSTHYRATCNFNIKLENGGINHRDYLRVSFCADNHFFRDMNKYYCARIEYVNIRGRTCRQCNIPIWAGTSKYHKLLSGYYTSRMCDKWKIPNTVYHEKTFGHYDHVNPRFSCSNSSTSTTNWWIGGYY